MFLMMTLFFNYKLNIKKEISFLEINSDDNTFSTSFYLHPTNLNSYLLNFNN